MPDFKTSALFTGSTGEEAEVFICTELKKKGYIIHEQNYRSPLGEIDIIAEIKDTLSFVEVKYRKNQNYGHPAEFVSPAKQMRICKTAQWWLMENPQVNDKDPAISFDVAAITGSRCHYINNAYEAVGGY